MDRANFSRRFRNKNDNRTTGMNLQQVSPRVHGIALANRSFANAIMAVQHLPPPQILRRVEESCQNSGNACYKFTDFPLEMDDTAFNIMGRYSVALLHMSRFNMIFIRVKWITVQNSPMCAMISFGSTDNEIRIAVEECASNLEQYEHSVRNGARYPVSKSSVKYLESHHIVVIDKIHENFPDAIYWCSLCDFHMSNIQHVRAHFETHQHFPEEQRINERKDLLERMPPMSDNQVKAINALIQELLQDKSENGQGPIWERHMKVAANISELLTHQVFEKMGVSGHIAIYGSVITRTCTESSNLNMSIDIPTVDCSDAVETMKYVADLLNTASGDEFDVQFTTDVPMCIKLTVSNVCVRIAWRCESGLKFGKLLSVYAAVRPQFAELCRIVRKWAEVSGIYSVDRRQGGLTSYGFDLMVLYFLQQRNLLPCLHEMRPLMSHERKLEPTIDDFYENRELYESDVDVIIGKIGVLEEPWDLARLFVEFLCFYGSRLHQNEIVQVYTTKQIAINRSRWSRKLLQISDPFRTDNVVTFTKAYQTLEGPLLDVTLYQKLCESPSKRKGKRKRQADNGRPNRAEETKTMTPATDVKPRLDSNASSLPTQFVADIDDEEYTAAADELVEEDENIAKLGEQILEDMMPMEQFGIVLDARRSNGHQKFAHMDSNLQQKPSDISAELFLNITYLNGLSIRCDNSNDVMMQIVAVASALDAFNSAVIGCSIMDLAESLCGAYLLPNGQAFIAPKRSACGFLVASSWVNRVDDVIRLKKGLSEITLRLSSDRCLRVLQCIQLCGSYPIRRLQERLVELKALPRTSVLVLFGFDGDKEIKEKDETGLAEQCEAIGLTLWEGCYGEGLEMSRNMIASCPDDDFAQVEAVFLQDMESLSVRNRVDAVQVSLNLCAVQTLPTTPGTRNISGREEPTKQSRRVTNKERNERSKQRKLKRAERRRLEKEQAKQVLKQITGNVPDDIIAEEEDGRVVITGRKPVRGKEEELTDKETIELARVVMPGKKKRHSKRNKLSAIDYDVKFTVEKLISEILKEPSTVIRNSHVTVNERKCYEETSTVHNILLKDLTPENVEIDDVMVYSRRTMKRIRDTNPMRISRRVFEILESKRLTVREFGERDQEVEELLEMKREKIRHERKREQWRAQIRKELEKRLDKGGSENSNPFDEVTAGLTEVDWILSPDDESVSNNTEIGTALEESTDETSKFAENGVTVEGNEVHATQQVDRKKKNSHVCYESFFISLKEFDPQSLRQKMNEIPVDRFRYSFHESANFNNGYKPDIVCATCESSDHWSDVCPMMIIPKVENLSHKKASYEWSELERVIIAGYEKSRVKKTRINEVGEFVDRVRVHLQNELKKTVRLHMFGSLISGFGVSNSDEFRDDNVQPCMVENCDVYFHREVIPNWSKNQQSVGELFVGFLDYYARFDFGTQVVQIRRKKPLLKMEKDWNRSLCIEDPFDLYHNLGSGVTRKMFVFIVRNIHQSRRLFMLSDVRKTFLENSKHAVDQEMPPNLCDAYGATLLAQCQMGPAPTDRQCRICHRIGHFAESCQKNGQNIQRTPKRNELWTKRIPNGHPGSAPRNSHMFGTRSNAVVGERVFYRKNERPPRGMRPLE
ncbi:hypothetical protein GCK32_001180 [Trichostrongylus colubriformis]|uniref:C2H2-type domain-containing protein n=1 Tax=Trichostrongylus colubriformis TaxID=6319 RepID=A0AAN8FL95_TRICO